MSSSNSATLTTRNDMTTTVGLSVGDAVAAVALGNVVTLGALGNVDGTHNGVDLGDCKGNAIGEKVTATGAAVDSDADVALSGDSTAWAKMRPMRGPTGDLGRRHGLY